MYCLSFFYKIYPHVIMNYRRFWFRYRTRIISLCIIFLIFYLFYTSIYNNVKGSKPSLKEGFDVHMIQYELDKYNDIKNQYQLTGIILHWQRLNGVQKLVRTMIGLEHIFSHIIIWNNNPEKQLTFTDLLIEPNDRITIFNSKANIKDQAKYRSCEMAKTKACFYVDDDWDIKMYVRSLYSNFLLEPTILHAITDQYTYFSNLVWTFFDKSIDLHTGFSWIGCGSIFSRDNAIQHLKYLDLFLNNDNYRDMIRQGDQFFSIWMNQVPAQFNGRLLHSPEGAGSSFQNFDFAAIQHRASVRAIEVLETSLRHSKKSNVFRRTRASNTFVTYTKSPCSYNDRFMFFTNCIPIDKLEEIPFNITTDHKRSTRDNLPHLPHSRYKEDLKFFETFSTANAVDNDNNSCWKINRLIRQGDLYGIDFHTIQTDRNLSFSIEYLHEKSLQKKLEISISLDSQTWVDLPQEKRAGIIYKKNRNLVIFRIRLFPYSFQVFRFIRFMSMMDEESSFGVCDVRLMT